MRGQKYDYKIKYDDISRLFLLPKPDDVHMAFVIALDKPIRQGQQRYQYLVLQTNKDPDEIRVNLDEDTLKKEYGDDLQPIMRGSLSNLVAKTFKVIAKKKVFIPGKFSNANQQPCVKCALRANEGLLYPLEKQFVFIHKPPVLIRFNEVESVEFQRYAGGQGSTRNFDLCVSLKAGAASFSNQQEYVFSGIDRSDYTGLYNFLSGKNIRIKNLQEISAVQEKSAPVYDEDEIYGGPDHEMGEESEDEDYDEDAAAQDAADDSDSEMSEDDDDFGSEIDDDLDSDLEEARGGSKKKKKSRDEDDDDSVEETSPKKKRKKKGMESPSGKKAKKDPNKPKRPQSAFMIFSNENRARIKEENPDAKFGEMAKLLSAEYKNLGKEELADLDKKVRFLKVAVTHALSNGCKIVFPTRASSILSHLTHSLLFQNVFPRLRRRKSDTNGKWRTTNHLQDMKIVAQREKGRRKRKIRMLQSERQLLSCFTPQKCALSSRRRSLTSNLPKWGN